MSRRPCSRAVRDSGSGPVCEVGGRRAERAFVELRLAEDHRARGAKARHRDASRRDGSAAARQTRARRHAGNVEVVLDRDREPVETADHVAFAPPRGARGRGRHGAGVEIDERIETRIVAVDRRAIARGQRGTVEPSGGEPAQLLERRGAAQHVIGDGVCYVFRHRCPQGPSRIMAHANDATRNGVPDARLHDARDHESRSHDGARSARGVRKPRYQQIADTLREEIRRGEHAVGRFLESEAELKARFKVSRHTVRDALRVLDELGLIARRRGAGSIVRNAEVHRHFDLALHSIADLLQYDESSDFHARYTDRLVANQEIAGWLQTRLGTECILLHGVRIGPADAPADRERLCVPARELARPSDRVRRQEDAIRALLEDQFLARVGRVEQTLRRSRRRPRPLTKSKWPKDRRHSAACAAISMRATA